ncbi:MAG TPA: histidine triad nucleotide-binding protein [Myxococcota bacterium]|nr:histidine triad nucleotide-binding protein [Myxococcota bacterium]
MAKDPSCLFCRIAARELPAKLVFESERAVAFEDREPQAPTHVLVVPREHVPSTLEVTPESHALVGELVEIAAQLARERGFADDGYRLVFNTNRAAGQTVFHLHLHLLGGRRFGWPPG